MNNILELISFLWTIIFKISNIVVVSLLIYVIIQFILMVLQ